MATITDTVHDIADTAQHLAEDVLEHASNAASTAYGAVHGGDRRSNRGVRTLTVAAIAVVIGLVVVAVRRRRSEEAEEDAGGQREPSGSDGVEAPRPLASAR